MPVGQGLSLFRLLDENYVTFDPTAYNHLFDKELEKVIARTSDAKHRETLERMRGFNWLAYIAASVRRQASVSVLATPDSCGTSARGGFRGEDRGEEANGDGGEAGSAGVRCHRYRRSVSVLRTALARYNP